MLERLFRRRLARQILTMHTRSEMEFKAYEFINLTIEESDATYGMPRGFFSPLRIVAIRMLACGGAGSSRRAARFAAHVTRGETGGTYGQTSWLMSSFSCTRLTYNREAAARRYRRGR